MNQNVRYIVIGVVVIVLIVVAYLIYEREQADVTIDFGQLGVTTTLN